MLKQLIDRLFNGRTNSGRRAKKSAALVLILATISAVGIFAWADSPDPVLPLSGSEVVNADGSITLTVQGGWAWPTHSGDCNTSKTVGWAVDWNDASQPGGVVATLNGVTVDVGAAAANQYNPKDLATHYYPGPNPPKCGTYNAGLNYNTGNWGPGPGVLGRPGYPNGETHTYPRGTTVVAPCVVMYDMHNVGSSDLIAGGQGHDGDNSVQSNKNTPLGNGCFTLNFPQLTSNASLANDGSITDVAHLSGGNNPTGTITFSLYGPNDTNCTGAAVYSQATNVSGNGDYNSPKPDFTATALGTYRWKLKYTPDPADKKNASAESACNADNESVKVDPHANIQITPDKRANQIGHDHVLTITVMKELSGGNNFAPAGGVDATATTDLGVFANTNGQQTTTCNTNANGQCNVTLQSTKTGISTVTASATVAIDGLSLAVSTNGQAPNSAPAIKQWTNAVLTLTPKTAADQISDTHTLTAHLMIDKGDGAGLLDASGKTITFTPPSVGTLLATSCVTATDGTCTVKLITSVTGISTVTANWSGGIDTGANGVAQAATTSNDAVKQWTDAKLTLDPPSAVNRVNNPHTFTATLTFDHGDGAGFVAAPSETINFVSAVFGNLSALSCMTNASGQCTTVLTSTVTGSTHVDASWNGKISTAANGSALASAKAGADKIWVDALIKIEPPTATNEIGKDHVFTITVYQVVNGGAPTPAQGVVANASLTNANGATASFVGANSCTTDANGTCQVTINSPTSGKTTVTASATVTVNGTAINVVTDGTGSNAPPAVKHWVNAQLSVTPPDATNIVGHVHVFTAHLELDLGDGNGFVNAPAGETISWAKTSGVGTLSSPGTCVTDATGTCTEDLNSSVSGQTEVQATWVGSITVQGTASLTRSASAHKNWVKHPAIAIVKSGAALAHAGDVVTYRFKVTNTGDVPLTDVKVTDDVLGDIGTIGDMAVGATQTLSKDFTVPANVASVKNIGSTCGNDPDGVAVCANDHHTLIVIHPSIHIVKTASPTSAGPSDTVTYTYTVTNVGDTTLNNVVVTDDVIGNIGTIASLTPNQTVVLTKSFIVAANSPRTNIGTACGTDALKLTVCDTAPATIAIVLPIPPQARLPKTGAEILLWTAFGMVLIAAGLAMMKTRREFLAE